MFAEHPELVRAAQQDGDRTRAEFIEAYRPLVASVARSYRRHGAVDHDELMQQGALGLLKALKRYAPRPAVPQRHRKLGAGARPRVAGTRPLLRPLFTQLPAFGPASSIRA